MAENNCARCDNKLGIRKHEPRDDWQYQGKLCHDCFEFATANSPYFEAQYKQGYPQWLDKKDGLLIIQNFDDRRQIIFQNKENSKMEIPVESIDKFEIIDFTEESKAKKIATMGLRNKSTSKHLQIYFIGDAGLISPIFYLKEPQAAQNSISLLVNRYKKESQAAKPSQDMVEAIKSVTGKDLTQEESLGKLQDKHGEINKIMRFLEPDEQVLFVTRQSRVKPGGSMITTPNTIFATDKRILIRNPSMLGMRNSVENIPYDSIGNVKLEAGVFSSTIVFTGLGFGEVNRMSRLGTPRAWGRGEDSAIDAIPKKDAEELVRIIRRQMERVKGHKLSFTQVINQNAPNPMAQIEEDPLTILKRRLAKGEITKEEFEDLKSALE